MDTAEARRACLPAIGGIGWSREPCLVNAAGRLWMPCIAGWIARHSIGQEGIESHGPEMPVRRERVS
jgi:hypothetical protein